MKNTIVVIRKQSVGLYTGQIRFRFNEIAKAFVRYSKPEFFLHVLWKKHWGRPLSSRMLRIFPFDNYVMVASWNFVIWVQKMQRRVNWLSGVKEEFQIIFSYVQKSKMTVRNHLGKVIQRIYKFVAKLYLGVRLLKSSIVHSCTCYVKTLFCSICHSIWQHSAYYNLMPICRMSACWKACKNNCTRDVDFQIITCIWSQSIGSSS